MSSINQYIDAADSRRKARAAEFDDVGRMPMDEWVKRDGAPFCFRNLVQRALGNLSEAEYAFFRGEDPAPHLCDAGNLADLALSLLPEGAK